MNSKVLFFCLQICLLSFPNHHNSFLIRLCCKLNDTFSVFTGITDYIIIRALTETYCKNATMRIIMLYNGFLRKTLRFFIANYVVYSFEKYHNNSNYFFIICTFRDFLRHKFHFYIVYQPKTSLSKTLYLLFLVPISSSAVHFHNPFCTLRIAPCASRRHLRQKRQRLIIIPYLCLFSLPFLFSVKNTLRLRTKTTIFEMSLI